jgi:hypothetical protein
VWHLHHVYLIVTQSEVIYAFLLRRKSPAQVGHDQTEPELSDGAARLNPRLMGAWQSLFSVRSAAGIAGHVSRSVVVGYRGTVQCEAGHGHRDALLAPTELALGTQGWRVPDATKPPSRRTGEWRDGVR